MKLSRHGNERIAQMAVWDERARGYLTQWNLTEDEVRRVIRSDLNPTMDPSSSDVGHPILRFRGGDVVVVVGLREPIRPKILSVYMVIPGLREHRERTAKGGSGSSLPKTQRQLRSWIAGFGYSFRTGGSHDAVIDPETGKRVYTVPITPSDHRSLANSWRGFLRAHAVYVNRQEIVD